MGKHKGSAWTTCVFTLRSSFRFSISSRLRYVSGTLTIAHAAPSVFDEQQYMGTYIYSPTVHGLCRDPDMLKAAFCAFC